MFMKVWIVGKVLLIMELQILLSDRQMYVIWDPAEFLNKFKWQNFFRFMGVCDIKCPFLNKTASLLHKNEIESLLLLKL
jgi:hypothetical protein